MHCFGFPSDSGFVWDTRVINGKTEKLFAIYPGIFDGEVIPEPSFPQTSSARSFTIWFRLNAPQKKRLPTVTAVVNVVGE